MSADPIEHVWRLTVEHLTLLDDPKTPLIIRALARHVVSTGLLLVRSGRAYAQSFEVLQRVARGAKRYTLESLALSMMVYDAPVLAEC
jgi:hypothetical protein